MTEDQPVPSTIVLPVSICAGVAAMTACLCGRFDLSRLGLSQAQKKTARPAGPRRNATPTPPPHRSPLTRLPRACIIRRMAKVLLNAPLLAEVTGPTRSTRWRTLPSGKTTITGKATGTHRTKAHYGWWDSPYLTVPATWDAECKAWQTADRDYTRTVSKNAAEFRLANTKPHTSTYDAWMKQAMPHYLRGLPCRTHPLPNVAWKLHRLFYEYKTLIGPLSVPDYTQPPDICRTWGLWWVNCRFRHYIWSPPGHSWPATEIKLAIGFKTLWSYEPTNGFISMKFRENPPGEADTPRDGETAPGEFTDEFTRDGEIWTKTWTNIIGTHRYLSVTVSDLARDHESQPYLPHTPDLVRHTTVAWLDGDLPWCHWPQKWPSKRPPRTWLPPGWPPP